MGKALALVGGCMIVGAASTACAQITPFSFYGGYYGSNSFQNKAGKSIHLNGLEFGVQDSLVSLPILGSVSLGGSVVLGDSLGGGATGTLYRLYADYKSTTVPGSSFYGIAGFGYYYATGSSFGNFGGLGTEIGVGLPIKLTALGPTAAIEARYRWGRSATTGFSVGLNLSF